MESLSILMMFFTKEASKMTLCVVEELFTTDQIDLRTLEIGRITNSTAEELSIMNTPH